MALLYREFRIRTTGLMWAFFDLVMPLVYLLLFGLGLDKAMPAGVASQGISMQYTSFFLAGVLSMASFGIAINTSYGFFVDRDNGIFYEFLTYPMTRGEFLLGKVLFNCLLSLVQAMFTVTLGVLLLDVSVQWQYLPILVVGVLLGTAGWFFFLTIFALRIRRNDMFNTFINVAYFVLMFASSLFYPVDGLPEWLHVAANVNPLTWHTDVLRFVTVGLGEAQTVLFKAVAFFLFLCVSFTLAVKTMKHAILK